MDLAFRPPAPSPNTQIIQPGARKHVKLYTTGISETCMELILMDLLGFGHLTFPGFQFCPKMTDKETYIESVLRKV